jgi:hypothetical protein
MRFKAKLQSNTGIHELDLDLSHVKMSAEQQAIADRLFTRIKNEPIAADADDPCEAGKCLASKHLSPDEFSKIRGLKAQLGTSTAASGIIADFCLHVVVIPH